MKYLYAAQSRINRFTCCALSLALALCMVSTYAPIHAFAEDVEPSVQSSNGDTILVFNQALIDQVGKQSPGGVACLTYAAAYCQTIVDNQVYSWTYFDGNGGAYGEEGAYGRNMSAEFNQYATSTDEEALWLLYNSINEGHPCIAQVATRGSSWHWVAVVGYVNITSEEDLVLSNFLMLDPGWASSSTPEQMIGCSFLHSDRLGDIRVSKKSVQTANQISEKTSKVLCGTQAYETAIEVSEYTFARSSCSSVVLARDDDFRDSLSASGLAGALNCPILLINSRDGLYDKVITEIQRLGATTAYIVGGPGAITKTVDDDLYNLGITPKRVYGQEAPDTSVDCAEKILELTESEGADYAVVAMSDNFQDALSMSSFAYAYKTPVILETSGVSAQDRTLPSGSLSILNAVTNQVIVAGGPGAISDDSLEGVSASLWRIYGDDGYDTSNQIAIQLVNNGLLSSSVVTIASGAPGAKGLDALAGCSFAGQNSGVILLANGRAGNDADQMGDVDYATIYGRDSQGSRSFLEAHAGIVSDVVLLGGSYVMPSSFISVVDGIWLD